MHMPTHSRSLLALLTVFLLPLPARSDWPMARHDGRRSGAAQGTSDLKSPVPYWRTYLGGSLQPQQLASVDLDADGRMDLLLSSSGRIVAKRSDDSVIWQSRPYDVRGVVAIADLNGDGTREIVADATSKVLILSLADGRLLWEQPDGELGTLGRSLVVDLDGDRKPDVLSVECGCCGVNSGKTGFARSFATGFASPALLFTLPKVACGGKSTLIAADVDGDGVAELMQGHYDHVELFRGKDGKLLASSAMLGNWISSSSCYAANLDGAAGDEVVCILNDSNTPGMDQRKVFALRYDGTASLQLFWKVTLAPDVSGDAVVLDPVADLDGDGKVEVVVSGYDPAASGFSTRILDASTGADLVPAITGHRFVGSATMQEPGKRLFLTQAGNTLLGWSFARKPSATVTQRFQVADRTPVYTLQPQRLAMGGPLLDLFRQDLDGDGLEELIVRTLKGAESLIALTAVSGSIQERGTAPLTSGTRMLNMWRVLDANRQGARVALARSDGVLELLDGRLQPITTEEEFPRKLSLRIGGYYASGGWRELRSAPRAIAFRPGGPDSIIVADSRAALLRMDPLSASWAVPPVPVWERKDHQAPTLVPRLDGSAPAIACLKQSDAGWSVAVLRADGSERWTKPIESDPLGDLVPATLNADATTDLVVQWGDPRDVVLRTRGISGIDGAKLWDAAPMTPGAGRQPAGFAVGPWNSDGFDDVYTQGPKTQVLSGANGALLASGGSSDGYFMPSLVDNNSDGSDEVLMHGGFTPVRLYDHALASTLWMSPDDDRPFPYGAVARCPQGPIFVEGSLKYPARLKRTPLSGASLGRFATQVLAAGRSFVDEASALAASAYLGQLTSAAVHQDLTGTGHPTVVLGSSDGFLYGINACDGSLDFAVPFGVAVGEAIFADTDGDGKDEIVVSAADGYLYALKNQSLPSPAQVLDIDPEQPGERDVDAITTSDRMSARGSPVPGAQGYEVAVVTADGRAISDWKNVGLVSEATVGELSLQRGVFYLFAVRALSTAGRSVDALSDGISLVRVVSQDAGSADLSTSDDEPVSRSGCDCHSVGIGSTPTALGSMWLALLALLLQRRRIKRRSPSQH